MHYHPTDLIGEYNMNGKKILICDDEIGVRESLKLILSDKYNLLFAENGTEALDLLQDNPDTKAVLLDIKMPGMNGMEALKQIRSRNNKIAIIVITGYQSVETASRSIQSGATRYITKPFETETIINTVKEAIL